MTREAMVALNVQVSASQKRALDRMARDEEVSSAAVVRRALRLFLAGAATKVAGGPGTVEERTGG